MHIRPPNCPLPFTVLPCCRHTQLTARVDESQRRRIQVHHTATHLLQSALKQVLGQDTSQQGSLVDASRLRFDFNLSRPMTAAELAAVESLVNGWAAAATPTSTRSMALDDARAAGATAMFGEKYDDVVRVVEVPGVSMELCGGAVVFFTSSGGVVVHVQRVNVGGLWCTLVGGST
jgi:alanyl-tRNA synthetase